MASAWSREPVVPLWKDSQGTAHIPRFDFSMLIILSNSIRFTLINTLLAVLHLLLVHWLDVRALG